MPSISDIIKNKTTRDAARTEQRQMERESISAMRDSSLTMITSSQEHYMEYLNLQADNIQCSVGNVALTMAQLQGATQIGSTDYWHSQGRYVRDDAINAGAKVFVPPRNKQYRGYFMGNYYDVSQTTGKPLPEQAPLTDQDPRMDMALAALMDQSPVTVAESRDIDAPAYYDPERLTIFINPDCSHTAVFATLAAEIPLARVHDRGYNASFSREYYSLDAKSAGYMVCRRFGVECPTVIYTATFASHGETQIKNSPQPTQEPAETEAPASPDTPASAGMNWAILTIPAALLLLGGAGFGGWKLTKYLKAKKRGYVN